MRDKHLDTQKGSLKSSVKDPIPIPSESDVISDGDYDDDYQKRIFPDLPIPDSLIMEDEHLDTIPVTESANTIKSSVEDLVPTPSESADLSDGESECDVPINDDSPESHFSTFDNPLFDSNDDFSSDDESLSEEDIQKDEFKYFSNPLYDLDNEIITNEKILPNQKDLDVIDSIFDEFSLPQPPEESNSEYFDATIESLFPSPIPVEDSDSLMEEIDLFLASDDSMPPGIEIDDYDSEGDIRFLEELLNNDSPPCPKMSHFFLDHFLMIHLFPVPPPEYPPDV
ncbi:hypothetical protein Tco_1194032 [Tanacetum coccineum]